MCIALEAVRQDDVNPVAERGTRRNHAGMQMSVVFCECGLDTLIAAPLQRARPERRCHFALWCSRAFSCRSRRLRAMYYATVRVSVGSWGLGMRLPLLE